MSNIQENTSSLEQLQGEVNGVAQNIMTNNQFQQQTNINNQVNNFNKQQFQTIQSISEAPERDESSALHFDEDLVHSQRFNSQFLEQSLNQKSHFHPNSNQQFNSIYSQLKMDQQQQQLNPQTITQNFEKKGLQNNQQNQQMRNQNFITKVENNNIISNTTLNNGGDSSKNRNPLTNMEEIQRIIKASSQRIAQSEQLVAGIDERSSEGSFPPQQIQAGIPFEIKDYAIQGNVSAKQSLLNCERGEFYDSQTDNQADAIYQPQNEYQSQGQVIPVKDPKKQEMLDTLQQNLNMISNMMQKNVQQQSSPKYEEFSDGQHITTAQDTEESNQQTQFDNYFQQSIQKQLQNIKQIKAQGEYTTSIQQQVLNSRFLSPQSQKQQQALAQNAKQQGQSNQPSSSKKSVQSYQQLYASNKMSSPSPSHNLKSFEKNSLSSKQSPGSNNSGKNSLTNNQQKPRDFQETYKPNQQNGGKTQNSINTTPNQDSKKIQAIHYQYQQQQLQQHQNPQQQQFYQSPNQYIPLFQQIQNQINNNRFSEDSVKQSVQQQQQQQIQPMPQQQLQQQTKSKEEIDKQVLQQQLIEKQKQIILKRYEETILKQQQELNQKSQQNQKRNSQDINPSNGIRKQQSMISQKTESEAVTQQSPARSKTVDENSSNAASPKHIYLKLDHYKPENDVNKQIGQDEVQADFNAVQSLNSKSKSQQSKRLDTDSSVKQVVRNSSQKQLSSGKKQQGQQKSASTNNIQRNNFNFINTDQKMNNMAGDQQKSFPMSKGSSYQNYSSLQLIRKMMEQKDFKKLEVPKDFDSQDKGYQDYRISYENSQSPEIRNKKRIFQNDLASGMEDTSKTEKSGSAGRDYSLDNQKSNENQSNIGNGGIEQSFQEKTDMSIQSINPMKLSNISKTGKVRNSQESMMKSFEERKKYTFATNNQKCIIFTRDTKEAGNQQQNNSFNNKNSHQQSYMNSKIGSGTIMPSQEDLYFVYGSQESLHSNNPHIQQQQHQQYLQQQQLDNQQAQNYYTQYQYEDQVRQSQILQHEDEEAIQHQQYLREQDQLLLQQQQQLGYNPNHPSPQVYEYTDQGFIKTNAILEQNGNKQNDVPIIHDFEEANSEIQHQNIEQSQQQSAQLMNSNHMTFGPNQQNNLKQHMAPAQVIDTCDDSLQNQANQQNVVKVNQMLKMKQIQTNQAINLESYQVSNVQSPDNHRGQQQGVSVYSSIAHLSPQSYHQQNQLRGRIGSNNSNIIKLNTSSDTCNMSRISNKTGNYNHPNMSGFTGSVIGHMNQGNSYIKFNNNGTPTSNQYVPTQQNQSYISALSNNTRAVKDDRTYTNADERTPTNVQQINKKEFNWLDYSSFERNNIWLKLKQQNRQNLKQEINEREQIQCTFKPSLIASKKPSLQKQYTQSRLQTTTKIIPSYSSSKKNIARDYSDISRVNPTTNTTINNNLNNPYSQNSSSYQLSTAQKPNQYSNNVTANSAMKKSQLQYNIQPIQNIDQPYQFLSQAQSPTSLHQEMKKAMGYKQISQLKKSISSTPNLNYGIPLSAPNTASNKQRTQQTQQSSKKQTPYKQFKPSVMY